MRLRLLIPTATFLLISFYSFSQTADYTIPAGYETEISKEDYKKIVDVSVAKISTRYSIDHVKEGTIYLKDSQEFQAFNLHNLIDQCAKISDRSQWSSLIEGHFNNVFSSVDAKKKIDPSNFESARKYLSIRVYPKQYLEQNAGLDQLVLKSDIEGTYTVLMLDLPGAFNAVDRNSYTLWKKDTSDAFTLAQANVNKQEISKERHEFDIDGMKVEIFILENEDYAGSYILDLQNNSPDLVGNWGSAIAIPNKQVALVCKISRDKPVDFVKFIQRTKPIVEKHYRDHPQPISDQFFWYYKGKFTMIKVLSDSAGNVQVLSPTGLTELMTEK